MSCATCDRLGIGSGSNASWTLHTSVDEAVRNHVPKASRFELILTLAHMDLSNDTRVSLRKRVVAQLRRKLSREALSGGERSAALGKAVQS